MIYFSINNLYIISTNIHTIVVFPQLTPNCPLAGLFKLIPNPGQPGHCIFSCFPSLSFNLVHCPPLTYEIGGPKYPEECSTFWIWICCSLAVWFSCSHTTEIQAKVLMDSSCITSEDVNLSTPLECSA